MAAVPGHLFFRCCLALLLRNVHRRVTGRGSLDTTGPGTLLCTRGTCLPRMLAVLECPMRARVSCSAWPLTRWSMPTVEHASHGRRAWFGLWYVPRAVVAGACLERFHKQLTNYSVPLTLGTADGAGGAESVAIYRVDYRPRARAPGADGGEETPTTAVASATATSALATASTEPSTEAAQYSWTPVVAVHAWRAHATKGHAYVDYLDAWRTRGVFRNRSEGCTLPVDDAPRRWVPGTATRLARYWDMVT